MAKNICTMQKVNTGMSRFTQYGCNDFKFGGRETTAYAYFIDGKFLRLAADVAWSEMTAVTDLIFKKYGPLSSKSTKEKMLALDSKPNVTAYFAFDQDTVYLLMQTDENMNKAGVVLYSDPSFEQKALEVQQAALADDL